MYVWFVGFVHKVMSMIKVELPGYAIEVYKQFNCKYFNGRFLTLGLEGKDILLVPEDREDFIEYLAKVFGVIVLSK